MNDKEIESRGITRWLGDQYLDPATKTVKRYPLTRSEPKIHMTKKERKRFKQKQREGIVQELQKEGPTVEEAVRNLKGALEEKVPLNKHRTAPSGMERQLQEVMESERENGGDTGPAPRVLGTAEESR
jgi:predicted RNase H-like HicB family nuclease